MSRLINQIILLAALASMFCSGAAAVAEDAVLLTSTVPGYVPGMVITSADRLSMPDGGSVTLLFQSGGMLRLHGPFEGTLSDQQMRDNDSSVARLADLFRLHGVDATVIGGTRSTADRMLASTVLDDVQVDPQRSGNYCFSAATSVWITRPTSDSNLYFVRRKGTSRALGWPSGSARVEWPADIPIEDGSQFEIVADGAALTTVTFHEMPAAVPSVPARVAKGLILGCHDQFDKELRRVSQLTMNPELWITTDRGRKPTYKVGEPITLTIVTDMDGYLYCIAADNGGAVPIFPSGAIDGAQLHSSLPLSIPGRRQPFGLTAVAGLKNVKCWLADRDVTPELPHALLGPQTGRLPDQLLIDDINGLFTHLGGTRITTDGVPIQVE